MNAVRIQSTKHSIHHCHGTTLVEIILYAAILVVISVFVINSILVLNTAIIKIRLERKVHTNADQVMQKMVREIRLAEATNASSTFGVNPGNLSLQTIMSPTDQTVVDAEFYLQGGQVIFRKGPTFPLVLTEPGITVSDFIFNRIVSTTSKAVKFEVTLGAGNKKLTASSTFYSTIILRRSYQ